VREPRRYAGCAAIVVGLVTVLSAAGGARASSMPGVTPELLAKARERGSVRVIVRLRVPDGADARAISAAQDAVLAELAAVPHTLGRRYTSIPFLSLAVSEAALQTLAASSRVMSIAEDTALQPLPSGAAH